MRYDEWQVKVPNEIKGDSLWKLEVYRLALFIADIAWQDALALNKNSLTRNLADQLYRAVCSISANIALVFSNIHWVPPVKLAIGTTNLITH